MTYLIEIEVKENDAAIQERAKRNFPDLPLDRAIDALLLKELQGCLEIGHFSGVPSRLFRRQ